MLDNLYLLEQTCQEIEGNLPATYSRQLPKLAAVEFGCSYLRALMLTRTVVIPAPSTYLLAV
ncbi:MAG TPA: hypothetical protein P5121_08750 [Caldilineaceae bacterium]|nr:hypothetical protein [Caldilineaceae bacterium]